MNIISWDSNRVEGGTNILKLALKTRQSFALMALALGFKCFLKELVIAQYILILGSLGNQGEVWVTWRWGEVPNEQEQDHEGWTQGSD